MANRRFLSLNKQWWIGTLLLLNKRWQFGVLFIAEKAIPFGNHLLLNKQWRFGYVLLLNIGWSVHIPSFSKTRSPWTVHTFGVIPEQGKKLNQNSLFHSSTAKRTYVSKLVNLRTAQNVFWLLPYLFSYGPNGHLSLWICMCYTMF